MLLSHSMIRSSCIVFLSIIALFLTYQVGLCEPHDVQQGPLCLGWGILVSIQAGGRADQEQPCQAGLGGTGEWEAGHEPTACTCSPEKPQYPGHHAKQCGQQGRETILLLHPPWWDPTCRAAPISGVLNIRMNTPLGVGPGEWVQWSEGTLLMQKDWDTWGCSAWRTYQKVLPVAI